MSFINQISNMKGACKLNQSDSPFIADRALNVSESGIRKMFNLSAEKEGLVHLEIGESDFETPTHIVEAAKKAMDQGYTGYTANLGYLELRNAIADKLLNENGIEANPHSDIIVTTGAMQALSMALLVTINPGDEVIIPDPAYESFQRQVQFAGGIPVSVKVEEKDKFELLSETVEKSITKKTKIVIINTPGNPTGSVATRKNLEGISELAKQHDLLILTDEIYENNHFSIASLPDMKERVISVFGFSKTYAMTGWRVGYAVSCKEVIAHMNKIQEFYVTCAPSISQKAAIAALEGPQDCVKEMVLQFQRRRNILCKELCKSEKLTCVKPGGAFYAFPNISQSGMNSTDFAELLLRREGVVVVPGDAFGDSGRNYIRLCFASSEIGLQNAAQRIRRFLDET